MINIKKIKQSEIEKIVNSIIEEQNFDDTTDSTQPEELPTDTETGGGEVVNPNGEGYDIVVDRTGKHYVINSQTGDIIAEK